MFRTSPLALTLLALSLASCVSKQHIVQTGARTYRLRCETSLAECLQQVDTACQQGFEVREGRDLRERTGVDVVGSGATETRTSEAVVVCRSDALIGGKDDEDQKPVRLRRERVCDPGSSHACVGPGGCAGGQSCLADGTGYDRCDCGSQAAPAPSGSLTAAPPVSIAPGTALPPKTPSTAAPTASTPAANAPAPSTPTPNTPAPSTPGPGASTP
jgi:hypothetical protein